MLEKEPMDILTQDNQLKAYKHEVSGNVWIQYEIKNFWKIYIQREHHGLSKIKLNIVITGITSLIGSNLVILVKR